MAGSVGAVRIGVVGLGGWGKNVVQSFGKAKRCTMSALCDTDAQRLRRHEQLFPQAIVTDNYDALLSNSEIDAVAIVTPAPEHYSMARAALLAGKHVYVEKPMTLRVDHAEELVRLSEQTGRKLMVGHLLEYHPAVNLIKQAIEDGTLGDIYYMYCQRLNLGVVRSSENAFWSLAPHDISVILYLLGAEPDSITARGECYLQPGIEDVVFVNLHFPDGRMAQIHVSWLDPNKERKIVVVGSKKMLIFDDMEASEKLRIYDKGASVPPANNGVLSAIGVRHGDIHIPHIPADAPLDLETQHFIDAILDDTTPRSDGQDGLRVVRVLDHVGKDLRTCMGAAR